MRLKRKKKNHPKIHTHREREKGVSLYRVFMAKACNVYVCIASIQKSQLQMGARVMSPEGL